jgi:hypothetical protein
MCTKACSQNAQCGNGLICSGPLFSNISGGFCADPCRNNAQCPTGRSCQLRGNLAGTGVDTVCGEPFGTLATGTVTNNGLECPSGFTINGRCSELCIPSQNTCPAAMAFCVDVTFNGTNVTACSNVNPNP